ncbi:MAG: diacylglycerol kinase family protein [Myxococcota bacterium]
MAEAARTALILNANAKHVTARKARQLAQLCEADHVYVSRSLEDAERVARTVVERGYDRVLSGGGDGTLVQVLNSICALRDAVKPGGPYPQVGVLKLGTGNAVAAILGAEKPEDDLLKLMSEPRLPTVPLELIHSPQDGLDFPFAGIGYDGEILNDYNWVKEHMRGPVVDDLMHSVLGYFTALFSRTLPRKLSEKGPPKVRITTRGKAIFRDPNAGDAMREIPAGSVLYEGPAAMVSVGTVPFYGFNFRIFPFAQDVPGMMQLRVVATSPWTILRNLPAIWRGEYRDPEVYDFHVEDIVVEGESALPFQIAGDAKGHRDRLEFVMSRRRIDLVSPRNPDELQ